MVGNNPIKPNDRKILLIEPPFYRLFKDTFALIKYPLGLGYLAGTIMDKTNWNVMVYNADFSPQSEWLSTAYLTGSGFYNYQKKLKDPSWFLWNEIKNFVAEHNPFVVGISTRSQNFASACIVAKLVKEINTHTIVIMGGPHISMVGAKVLDCLDVDICVEGEGELTIVEVLKAIENNTQLNNIKGVIYRKNGQIIENPPREFITDLDSLCFPHENASKVLKDYTQYPLSAFKSIFATRGCPYSCFFCGSHKLWSRQVRFRSPDNVTREINALRQKGLKSVHFEDDTFGINREYINALCNALIRDCSGVKWSCEIHVNLINDQIVSLMKRAGCYLIQIGIESGNNEILKIIRKGFTIEKALTAVNIAKKHNIEVATFFMIGFPWETEQTLQDTIRGMKNIKSDYLAYSIFMPYPGTEIFRFCKEQGLITEEYDVSLYNHQSPANHFCINIPKERFRAQASQIEKMVDRINKRNVFKRIFSATIFFRIREFGIIRSISKAIKLLFCR